MMTRKVLILKGSPRPNGNSSFLANQVQAGASAAGSAVESFTLHDMDIRPCEACNECLAANGVCIQSDDMQVLYPKIAQADALVVASPVYWYSISAQLKLVIDRWYTFEANRYEVWPGKQAGIIMSYNAGGHDAIRLLETIFRYLGMKTVGVIHGVGRQQNSVAQHPLKEEAYQLGLQLGSGK
jgi:multimeric flavodoxin WrbA